MHPIEQKINIEQKKIYNKIHKQMNKSKWYALNKLAIIVETFLLVITVSKFRIAKYVLIAYHIG